MRRSGFVDSVDGLSHHDHVGWVFDTPGDFRAAATRFLADGLAGGQRVLLVTGDVDGADLSDDFAAARDTGAAVVLDVGMYRSGDPYVPVETYARAVDEALADGFTGLRVAADVTSLVRTAEDRAAFARYERLADELMIRSMFSALCAYDRAELGAAEAAELVCVHPVARRSSVPLRLHNSETPGIAAVLAGDVDMHGYALLRTALDSADLTGVDGTVTIDARDLAFIDHRGLIQLVEHVRARGATTVLSVGARSVIRPLAQLLRLPDLQVVTA
ncbi:MEDS domain-containing protein [Hamadaea tsunoensis]|uniref:MEDS domain-containing protein n=1 Tax=Hamadaea tsunoensis TaxID=53368 RepID=UPI0004016A49|nr:MEDS domain-containing protein [Hamadaea tsunoensis]